MSADVLMPQLGETVAEGRILTWFKQVGAACAARCAAISSAR